jgi:hypothetical protein
MAKQGFNDATQNKTNTFLKGLNKDSDPSFVNEGMWTHARNASNNTREGDLATLSNEASNILCAIAGGTLPDTKHVIGAIHLYNDKWVIFTAAHIELGSNVSTGSEIGLFENETCSYRPIVQGVCLNFSQWHLITGASRMVNDCSWQVYWSDGFNPDRYLNIGDPQTWPDASYQWQGNNLYSNGPDTMQWPGVAWKQLCTDSSGFTQTTPGVWPVGRPVGCITCEDTQELDCDKIRLARLMETPCLHVSAGKSGGSLRNGSYFALMAYSISGQKVTDWFSPSNVQPLWYGDNPYGALEIDVNADNKNFDEFILVVVSNVNQGANAKQIGIYSTSTQKIYIDQIKEDLINIPIEQLPIQTPVFEKSDQMVEVNNYLLRVGPTSKFDFNYQPLANLITANWVSVEYPSDYYTKGGHKPSYLRDEVYAFFIRWIYDTGDKSASYHIPGRAPNPKYVIPCSTIEKDETEFYTDTNTLFGPERVFEIYNTASGSAVPPETLDDGGVIIARGQMAYWQSTEKYPDNTPNVWNASYHCWTGSTSPAHDLCSKEIRHHKFPDNDTTPETYHFRKDPTTDVSYIRILGVEFNNIVYPKDNDGIDIPGIVGYEILRGSREGNKSIIAKGMLNNMRPYKPIDTGAIPKLGLYPNHPFNTILADNVTGATDPYIIYGREPWLSSSNEVNPDYSQIFNKPVNPTVSQIPTNIITFHSPDTNFRTPYLSAVELKLYGRVGGQTEQQFIVPNKHPKVKLISNLCTFVMIVGGVAEAIIASLGKRTINQPGAGYTRKFGPDYTQEDIGGGSGNMNFNFFGAWTPVAGSQTGSGSGSWSDLSGNGGDTEEQEYTNETDNWNPSNTDLGGDNDQFVTNETTYSDEFNDYLANGGALFELSGTGTPLSEIYEKFNLNGGLTKGGTYTSPNYDTELSPWQYFQGSAAAAVLSPALAISKFLYYFSEGADITLRAIYLLIPYRQYALQMIAHCFYDMFYPTLCNFRKRFKIADSIYINDTIQELKPFDGAHYRVHNLKRQNTVVIRTTSGAGGNSGPDLLINAVLGGAPKDDSLVTAGTQELDFKEDEVVKSFNKHALSHYAGLKYRIQNQYGQLQSIKQIPITPCEQKLSDYTIGTQQFAIFCPVPTLTGGVLNLQLKHKFIAKTIPLFNGDTYINRYTEKNTMFFFYDWLYGQPDGTEFNYFNRQMIPETRFKMNSEKYESSNLSPGTSVTNLLNPLPGQGLLPNSYYKLDNKNYYYTGILSDMVVNPLSFLPFPFGYPFSDGYPGAFSIKNSYFYLSTCSVRDFFVESEVIVDFREPGTYDYQRHYDPYRYTDLVQMFNMDPETVTRGNYYAYDYSLSISKIFTQYFSQGNLQTPYYDPNLAKLCYTYYPDRIIYSLPQQQESEADAWFMFLANNYVQFKDKISGIKNFAKTGIFITFKNSSPLTYQGVDQLQTDFGTKITIGDGGLFAQTPQSISLADGEYEYGSSQSKRGVISTPAGLYYISQNQGKIFTLTGSLDEISQNGMKWWFAEYLPYKLLLDFPNYPHLDNPVAGIGCHASYDNRNSVVYFSKRDFRLKPEYKGIVLYDDVRDRFSIGKTKIVLGDPTFFDDASWTISYDPKSKFWISFHDWHPNLFLPTKNTFLTIKGNGLWRHNDVCNSYCNYYGLDYPFEIEYPMITGQTVTTLRSFEYILECTRRSIENCVDQYSVLDYNFDKAVVFNSEQVSGYLNLNVFPKNNVTLSLQYPQINLNSIDILFSKEENKYRFNQFWDITKDRGEFPTGSNYPPTGPLVPGTTVLQGPYTQENIWVTEPNGYIKSLNPVNLDYQKPELQRKKFRHYLNFLNLSRSVSGDVNMILKITNNKNTYSPR